MIDVEIHILINQTNEMNDLLFALGDLGDLGERDLSESY